MSHTQYLVISRTEEGKVRKTYPFAAPAIGEVLTDRPHFGLSTVIAFAEMPLGVIYSGTYDRFIRETWGAPAYGMAERWFWNKK